jgi:drug/metabolite transporter (DMT)-like permease
MLAKFLKLHNNLAYIPFIGNSIIFGCYYPLTKEVLTRWSPLLLIGCAMVLTCSAGVIMLARLPHAAMNRRQVFKWAALLGSFYGGTFLLITVALQYTSATETAYFPLLNGLVAVSISRFVLHRTVRWSSWGTSALALLGGGFLMLSSPAPTHLVGDLIMIVATVAFVTYGFQLERVLDDCPQMEQRAIFGGQWFVVGIIGSMAVLFRLCLPGNFMPSILFPQDIGMLVFLAVGVFLLPNLFTWFGQQFIAAQTVAFMYILEPLIADLLAAAWLHERYSTWAYIGILMGLCAVLMEAMTPWIARWHIAFANRGESL